MSTTQPATTSSSFFLPIITTKEPRQDFVESVKLTVDDLAVAGVVLMVVVAITIIMNLYTIGIVGKHWSNLVQFPFAQSNLICMFLSLADLLLGCFLGLPAAIHLRYAEYFSEQPQRHMIQYSRYVGYFLLDYMFIFRSIIIAVICIDRCVHILKPLAYKFRVSHQMTIGIIVSMTVLPLLARVVPQIVVLYEGGNVFCAAFRNPDPNETIAQTNVDMVNFTVPLTCNIEIWLEGGFGLSGEEVRNSLPGRIALAEVILFMTILVVTFLSIIVSNVIILVVIVRRSNARKAMMHEDESAMKKKLMQGIQKTLLATSIMAIAFLLSNGPFVVIWVMDYVTYFFGGDGDAAAVVKMSNNEKLRLYLAMSMFLSLLVNPWLYPLRMETIRKFFPCFNPAISSDIKEKFNSTRSRFSSQFSRKQHSHMTEMKEEESKHPRTSLTGVKEEP